jgi:hypothetical protein
VSHRRLSFVASNKTRASYDHIQTGSATANKPARSMNNPFSKTTINRSVTKTYARQTFPLPQQSQIMKPPQPFFATCIATLCLGGFAIAQQQDSQSDESGQRSQQESQAEYRVSPRGWIRIAVDNDNDGTFDTVETIFTYDLEKARKSSRDRANRDAQQSQDQQAGRDQRSETAPAILTLASVVTCNRATSPRVARQNAWPENW